MVHTQTIAQYPLLTGEFFHDGWKIPVYFGINKLAADLSVPLAQRTGNIPKILVGGFIDFVKEWSTQRYKTEIPKSLPLLGTWRGFAEGTSNVEHLYTVAFQGHELPIHLTLRERQAAAADPTDDQLTEGVRQVVRERKSPLNTGELSSYYNGDFDTYKSSSKYTRSDYENSLIDPNKYKKWLVRDDLWNIQQRGPLRQSRILAVDGTAYTVRKYGRPASLSTFWYWLIGDIVYDLIDGPFDPIQRQVNRILSHAAQQELTEVEYKHAITPTIRSLFRNSARLPLEFDLTD